MASVKLLLYTHKNLKDGSYPILLSILKDRKRRTISTGYSATIGQWSKDKNTVNAKHPHADKIKGVLKKKLMTAEKVILDLDDKGKPYTVDDIADALQIDKKPSSFKEYSEYQIERMKNAGQHGNSRVYNDAKNAFLDFVDKKDIDFKNVTGRLLEQFRQELLERGVKINSISVYLRTIRAIYNKAIKDDIVSEKFYPFKNFKIKTERTQKRALTKESITRIKDLDLSSKPAHELARDIFLFSFFNRGMNYIDICYLKHENLISERIRYRRHKTGQTISIGLTSQAQTIIDKYISISKGEYIFPLVKPGNEYNSYRTGIRALNRKLKDIGEEVEVDIQLTSYVARHSWATIAKRSGISTAIISEGLGHDSEQTTQIYLDSFEDKVLDEANDLIIDSI